MEYQVQRGCSVQGACEACNVAERTFYRWLSNGIFDPYLDEAAGGRHQTIRDKAIQAVERIMDYMIAIAAGEVRTRGANPISAAEFVFRHAGIEERPETAQPGNQVNILVGLLEMVRFDIRDATPVLRDGKPVVIQGEVIED
jgi:hypothetical protein